MSIALALSPAIERLVALPLPPRRNLRVPHLRRHVVGHARLGNLRGGQRGALRRRRRPGRRVRRLPSPRASPAPSFAPQTRSLAHACVGFSRPERAHFDDGAAPHRRGGVHCLEPLRVGDVRSLRHPEGFDEFQRATEVFAGDARGGAASTPTGPRARRRAMAQRAPARRVARAAARTRRPPPT